MQKNQKIEQDITQGGASSHRCIHCDNVVPFKAQDQRFCCRGCRYVYQLIRESGLENFYQLKDKKTNPKNEVFSRQKDLDWLDHLVAKNVGNTNEKSTHVDVSLEGLECAACVWLIKNLAKREGYQVHINSVLGQMRLHGFDGNLIKLKQFLNKTQQFGYPVGPPENRRKGRSEETLFKLGISALIAVNVMSFSVAQYLGLEPDDERLFGFFIGIIFILSTVSVSFGGGYFFKRSFHALRKGLFHFDVPISLGISMAYLGSTYAFIQGYWEHLYFDSLCVFITLMLAGRYVQEKWIEKNQDRILSLEAFSSLWVDIKKEDGLRDQKRFSEIGRGDIMLIRPGAILPTKAMLQEVKAAWFDTQWITGEANPRKYISDEEIPPGCRYLGDVELELVSQEGFKDSRLRYIDSVFKRTGEPEKSIWHQLSLFYVIFVLSALTLSSIYNLVWFGPKEALYAAIAISVVTCPCGIGIAIPMLKYFVHRQLMARGIFLRDEKALEKLNEVKHVVFDKTGTLTLSQHEIVNGEALEKLEVIDRKALFTATSQSYHPLSRSIYQYLLGDKTEGVILTQFKEVPGEGLYFSYGESLYFLGRGENRSLQQSAIFSKNEMLMCDIFFQECAVDQISEMLHELKNNYGLYMLSGDQRTSVKAAADAFGLNPNQVFSNLSPQDKEQWVQIKQQTAPLLYVGDGLNDTEALQKAYVSGVSLSQSFVAAHVADFYFMPRSIAFLNEVFCWSKKLNRLTRGNYFFALFYNIAVSFAAAAGFIGPLIAAIIMPLVSVGVISVSMKLISKP